MLLVHCLIQPATIHAIKIIGVSLNNLHTSKNHNVMTMHKNYDKSRVTCVCYKITVCPCMACIIVHATVSEWRRLQHRYKWFGVIIPVTEIQWRRLQYFHIWFGVIIYATVSGWCRLQVYCYIIIVYATIHKWHKLKCFRIYFSVIIHAMISQWCRLQSIHKWLVLSMPLGRHLLIIY